MANDSKDSRNPELSSFDFEKQVKKYEIEYRGAKIKAEGEEDHKRALEAVDRLAQVLPPIEPPQQPGNAEIERVMREQDALAEIVKQASRKKSPKISEVKEDWLAECKIKNKERTVYMKSSHFKDFVKLALKDKDVEVNELDKATLVAYRALLLKAAQKPKTIDNKLLSIADFFEHALKIGAYTAHNSNPVTGLYVLTKKQRIETTEHYDPFTNDDLKAFFESSAYKSHMNAPDLFWCPLLGIFMGLRISEAAQIRCEDVITASNDISYLYVYKSKTANGIRKIPIPQVLIDIGFLKYVEEVREIGAERVFPHRNLVNGTYAKRLSEEMALYQKARGVKRKGEKKSFHSFRVNFITALANNEVPETLSARLAGHSKDPNIEVHSMYIRDLPVLKEVIDRIEWPQINLKDFKYNGEFKGFFKDLEP